MGGLHSQAQNTPLLFKKINRMDITLLSHSPKLSSLLIQRWEVHLLPQPSSPHQNWSPQPLNKNTPNTTKKTCTILMILAPPPETSFFTPHILCTIITTTPYFPQCQYQLSLRMLKTHHHHLSSNMRTRSRTFFSVSTPYLFNNDWPLFLKKRADYSG